MLDKNNSLLLMIDVQEKLTDMLKERCENAKEKTLKLIKAADIMGIKTVITEQYPKGLGNTVPEIREILKEKYIPFEKTNFSAVSEDEILKEIEKSNKKQIVIFGIEAHICVFQTALELKEKGCEVFVVEDASYSRCDIEKEIAMKNLRSFGIMTPSVEMILFMWLKNSKNPSFKEVQSLIK